jgi:hypothetical protein
MLARLLVGAICLVLVTGPSAGCSRSNSERAEHSAGDDVAPGTSTKQSLADAPQMAEEHSPFVQPAVFYAEEVHEHSVLVSSRVESPTTAKPTSPQE